MRHALSRLRRRLALMHLVRIHLVRGMGGRYRSCMAKVEAEADGDADGEIAPVTTGFAALPASDSYRLTRARAPLCLVEGGGLAADRDGLALIDITVEAGRIASILPAGTEGLANGPGFDLDGGIVLPRLVDCHVHLDKGHIWPRQRNPDGSFMGALNTRHGRPRGELVDAGRARRGWSSVCAAPSRMARRRPTHIDLLGKQIGISWPVLAELRAEWAGRIAIQASPLFGIQFALDETHVRDVVAAVKAHGDGVFGCVSYMIPELDDALDIVFRTAIENGFDLDFHVDETNDPAARSLENIADAAIRHRFPGRILAGHCCSLALQEPEAEARIIAKVRAAGIAVVSLPMCNMYLQDRTPGRTPRWRGVTALHELKAAGVPVMIASDNTRDPFYAYGDLDLIEVLREGTRILQLDHAGSDWANAVARTPADDHGAGGQGRARGR